MARGVQLAFTLNPKDFIRGLKRIEVDLEGVADAMDDVARSDAFDDLDTRGAERGLDRVEDAADDAGRAFDDLGDEARSDLRTVEKAASDAGREVESELEGGTRDAEDAFSKLARGAKADMRKVETSVDGVEDELGDVQTEANQSAKEFGSSFRGDPVEALEEVQGYLSEIISVKLPGFAGAAATAAGGAALGLVVLAVEQWREKQERINEYANEYLGILTEGVNGPLAAWKTGYDELLSKQLALAVLEEASATQQRDLAVLAAARGVSTEEYIRLMNTGELTTQQELRDVMNERQVTSDEILRISASGTDQEKKTLPYLQSQFDVQTDQIATLKRMGGFINENVAGVQRAEEAEQALATATEISQERQRGANRETGEGVRLRQREVGEVEKVGRRIDGLPDTHNTRVDVTDDGSVQRTQERIRNIKGKTVYLGVVTDADALTQRLINKGLV